MYILCAVILHQQTTTNYFKTLKIKTMENKVTYKVEQNKNFGDYRVVKYLNGVWLNERDGGNWTKSKAEQVAKYYRDLTKQGVKTMSDNV